MDDDFQADAGPDTLAFADGLFAAVLADARSDPVRERCGLLLGAGSAVDGFLPAANVAKNPARHFELDPAVLIAAHRNARAGGPEIIGHYHSHPAGGAVPSARDTAMALPDGSVWLIISATDVRAWRAVANGAGVRFQTVRLLTEARLGRMGAA